MYSYDEDDNDDYDRISSVSSHQERVSMVPTLGERKTFQDADKRYDYISDGN